MIQRAGISPALVQPASPVASPSGNRRLQSSSTDGPPARWMAPSTPPPPRIRLLAALTTAPTCGWGMCAHTHEISTAQAWPTAAVSRRTLELRGHGSASEVLVEEPGDELPQLA